MKTARHRLPFAVLLFITLAALISAHAQITPSGDAYIDTTKPTTNYGAAVALGVVSPSQTTFIAFDLSSIPSGYTGSSIAKATLKLYVSSVTTAGSFNVDLVNGSWTEAKLTANNAPALGATIAASVPLTKSQARDYILIDITTALQDWLNGTPNDGIALVPNSPLSATFESKENIKESHNAELDVVFAGGGGTITGVLTAAGSGLTGGGSSGTLNLSLLTSCSSGQTLVWNGSAWACQTVKGTGTVTSVGLTAPASDFAVSGSPITTSGTLNISWLVPPDSGNTANAIVKRDSTGSFNAASIKASGQISVNSGVSLVPILSVANAAGATAIAGYAQGTGYTVGVSGSSLSSTQNSSGVFGFDQNSAGSAGNYTTGVVGYTQNKYGVGVLGYGNFSSTGSSDIGYYRVGVWGDDAAGAGVVATSDTGNAVVAVNKSTSATILAQNNSTGNAVAAVNTSTTDATLLATNNTNASNGLIFRATAPNVQSNGSPAACQINTRGDLGCSGDVVQTRPANGLVKALVYFDPAQPAGQQIVRCYNSTLSEPAASTAPCGFSYIHVQIGINLIDFGFTVNDRFAQISAVFVAGDSNQVAASFDPFGGPTQLRARTFYTTDAFTDTPFYLTVF
jgi:hypothetical protein